MKLFSTLLSVSTLMALSLLSASAQAETMDEAIARIDALAMKTNAFEMVTKTVTDGEQVKQTMESKTVSKKVNGKRLFHSTSTVDSKMSFGVGEYAQTIETKSETINVSDGQYMWTDTTTNGVRQVSKMKFDTPGEESIRNMLIAGEAKYVGKETLDGESMSVFTLTIPQVPDSDIKYWFSDKSGFLYKMVSKNPVAGTTTMTTEKFDSSVQPADSLFVYTPPEGIEVTEYEMPQMPQ